MTWTPRSRAGALAGAAALLAGCASGVTPPRELGAFASCGRVLYVGSVDDLRVGARPTSPPAEAAPDLVTQREVRIPVSEVRSTVADALERSGLFERVVSPPAAFMGQSPDAMIVQAQQASDYLLVAELNQFHIKNTGFNGRAGVSVPLDLLFGPIAFATYLTTGGNMYLFSGSLVSCWTAEVVLTMSVSLIDVSTGHVAHTVRLEERVRSPFDGIDAFGSLWDGSDDWVDLGRRLGERALWNASVELAARLDATLRRARVAAPASVTSGAGD